MILAAFQGNRQSESSQSLNVEARGAWTGEAKYIGAWCLALGSGVGEQCASSLFGHYRVMSAHDDDYTMSPTTTGDDPLDWDWDDTNELSEFFLNDIADIPDSEEKSGEELWADQEGTKPPSVPPSAAVLLLVPHSAGGATLHQARALNFPKEMFTRFNEGDLENLRRLIDEHMLEDSFVKTTATKGFLPNGRKLLFDFFKIILDRYPDGIMTFEQSVLDRTSCVVCKVFFTGTDVDMFGARSPLMYDREEVRKEGFILSRLLHGMGRKILPPTDKSKFMEMEKEMRQGMAKVVKRSAIVCRFKSIKGHKGDGPYVSKVEMKWKLKSFNTVDY